MARWRSLTSVLAVLTIAGGVRAQSYPLAENPLVDAYFHVEIAMSLTGEIKVQQDGKAIALKQTASGRHDYVERILEAGKGLGDKSARIYKAALADITSDKEQSSRVFREDRRFLVAQRIKDQTVAYCPTGLLTREELELTEHFDTLSLPGLLPGRAVKVGDTWKVANAAAQTLLDLDGLISQDLTCTLDHVTKNVAHVTLGGSAAGIDMGASVKMKIAGSYQFDIATRRIVALEWKQSDQREQGPISPGFQAEIVTKLKRSPIDPVQELNDFALVKIPSEPSEKVTRLSYNDPQGRYTLVHGRNWHLVSRSNQQLVMRLMDRGDFVAQLTITPYRKTSPGQHISEEDFKQAVTQAPGWEAENVEKGSVVESPNGYWIYRVGAGGTLNGVKAVQYFYVVAGPQGDQAVLTFTMAPAQAPNLNTRDVEMVRGLRFSAGSITPARGESGTEP
jgi:hypothetical protein